ncbi:MAG: hypothetical protein ABSG97_09855 [Sedimentisphaerales bacterium]|jgi:hypothetical protein
MIKQVTVFMAALHKSGSYVAKMLYDIIKMKKNVSFIVLLVLVGSAILLCLKLFCSSGRYQITFGHVRMEYRECDEEKTDVIPVCFKIDTFTGKCWVYTDYRWLLCDKRSGGHGGFQEIPKYYESAPH